MYHILVVDEEEHLLWALERNLFPERDDVEVHTAGTGEQGLQILEDQPIDLLISDIKMPGDIDGFQLILRAKEMVPDARVMIITAFGTHRIQNFAERIGISHYIEKPFTVDELRAVVLEVLDEQEGFQGVLSDLELTDIIQMLCLAKRTALLHLKHRERRGRIVFDAGEVIHAEFDGTIGAEAVYEMLNLRQGDIFMQSDFEPVDRTIDIGWQDLLLEGVKRTDEQRMEQQRQRTRREMGGVENGGTPADPAEQVPGDSDRNHTPMGMAAATLSDDSDAETSSDKADDAGAMLFSEEELQEISKASEAAVEQETGEFDAPVDSAQQESAPQQDPDESADTSEMNDSAKPAPADEDIPDQTTDSDQQDSGSGTGNWPGVSGPDDSSGQQESTDGEDDSPESEPANFAAPPDSEGHDDEKVPQEASEAPECTNGEQRLGAEASHDEPEDFEQAVRAAASEKLGADGDAEPPIGAGGPFASASPYSAADSGQGGAGEGGDTAATNQPEPRQTDAADGRRSGTSPGVVPVQVDDPDEPDPPADAATRDDATEASSSPDEAAPRAEPAARDEPHRRQLEQFVGDCPGVKVTALVCVHDRQTVELVAEQPRFRDEFDDRGFAAQLARLYDGADRSVASLQREDRLQELRMVLDDDYLLVRPVADGSLLHVAVVDRDISLGIALVLMRQYGETVRD